MTFKLQHIWFLVLLIPCTVYSQPYVDLINIKYQRFPNVKYSEGENRTVGVSQILGNVFLPLQLKNEDIIIIGATFDNLNFKTSDQYQNELNVISLQLGYVKTWKGGKWKTLFLALPKVSTDQRHFNKDAYQQGGVCLFTYTKNDRLKYKFGLYYNREFFGNFFIPLAGLEWKPNPKLNIYGVIPNNLNIEYHLLKKVYTGLSYQSFTSSYRLHSGDVQTFVRNGDRFWGHNQIRCFVDFYLTKNLVLYMEAGYTFFRRYETYINRTTRIDHPVYSKTNDSFLFNMGMAYRIRL